MIAMKVACGGSFSMFIKPDGSIVGWGNDVNSVITNIPSGTNFTQVACGSSFAVALRSTGVIEVWGDDTYTQITNKYTGSDVTQVSAGDFHVTILKSDGSVQTWGYSGSIGTIPVDTNFTEVAAGGYNSIGLHADGTLTTWGQGNYNTIANTPVTSDFVQVSAGGVHFVGALKSDGTIVTWGRNLNGSTAGTPVTSDFTKVFLGYEGGVGIKADGTHIAWGGDTYGQVSSLKQTPLVDQIGYGAYHYIASTTTDKLYGWGKDSNGQVSGIPSGYSLVLVGDVLTTPEAGWQRIDTGDTNISKMGTWAIGVFGSGNSNYWNDTYVNKTSSDYGEIHFTFYGTKLRLIDVLQPSGTASTNIQITIDDVNYTYNNLIVGSAQYLSLVYEKTDLPLGYHNVTIKNLDDPHYIGLDCIDIDDTGHLEKPVGSVLTNPEAGWQRVDSSNNSDLAIEGLNFGTAGGYWLGTYANSNSLGSVSFRFYGTKFRLVDALSNNRSSNIKIIVDGTEYNYGVYNSSTLLQTINYQVLGLTEGIHDVYFENLTNGAYWGLDAIDIDDTGYFETPYRSILTSPEAGWSRIDGNDNKITFTGAGWVTGSHGSYYNSTYNQNTNSTVTGDKVNFTFYGTKIRIIGFLHTTGCDVQVTVDNVVDGSYNNNTPTAFKYQTLLYEKTGLTEGVHTVELENTSLGYFDLDAIDLDTTGYLPASIGDTMDTPEPSWARFTYDNNLIALRSQSTAWTLGPPTYGSGVDKSVRFKFFGTKLRIIGQGQSNFTVTATITVDGTPATYTNAYATTTTNQFQYELTGLTEGEHEVLIENTSGESLSFNAVDIDDGTGYLIPTVWSTLTAPESGWQRIDETDTDLIYSGTWVHNYSTGGEYGGTLSYSNDLAGNFTFKFYGTKLRIFSELNANRSSNININIDGVSESYSELDATNRDQTLVYEKTGLTEEAHTVTVSLNTAGYYTLDAIDIDSTGYLMASVGSHLTAPETNWTRFDDTDSNISFVGTWNTANHVDHYNGSLQFGNDLGGSYSFRFYGTGIRIVTGTHSNHSTSINVDIDGVIETYSSYNASETRQTLVYEKTGLTADFHIITVSLDTAGYYTLDAFDIYNGYMTASIGDFLLTPDPTWQRIDDTDVKLIFNGTWASDSNASYWGGSSQYSSDIAGDITFKFYGTKLRILAGTYTNRSTNININIDGIDYSYSEYSASLDFIKLVYEKVGLTEDFHDVVISLNTAGVFSLDAVDIDDTGYIVANIGNSLPTPEVGWTRFDDNYHSITYTGTWAFDEITGTNYNSTIHTSTDIAGNVTFKFKGTDIRIIALQDTGRSATVDISIDGNTESYSEDGVTQAQTLVYEKTGLTDAEHTIIISSTTGNDYSLDAIDVKGYLADLPTVTANSNKIGIFDGGITLTLNVYATNENVRYKIEINGSVYQDWSAFDTGYNLGKGIALTEFNNGENTIIVYGETVLGGTNNDSVTIYRRDLGIVHVDSANGTTNYLDTTSIDLSTTQTVLVKTANETYDPLNGYEDYVQLLLTMAVQSTGTVKMVKITQAWDVNTVTYNTIPAFDVGNEVDVTFTNTSTQDIDLKDLDGAYGVALYTQGDIFSLDYYNHSSQMIYKETLLHYPSIVYYDTVKLEWEPPVLTSPDIKGDVLNTINLERAEQSNFSDAVAIFGTTDITTELSFEDTIQTSKTYYYRLVMEFSDVSDDGLKWDFDQADESLWTEEVPAETECTVGGTLGIVAGNTGTYYVHSSDNIQMNTGDWDALTSIAITQTIHAYIEEDANIEFNTADVVNYTLEDPLKINLVGDVASLVDASGYPIDQGYTIETPNESVYRGSIVGVTATDNSLDLASVSVIGTVVEQGNLTEGDKWAILNLDQYVLGLSGG